MLGYQFTWEKSRGSPSWIEERLDRAMTSWSWFLQFSNAIVYSLEALESVWTLPVVPWLLITLIFKYEKNIYRTTSQIVKDGLKDQHVNLIEGNFRKIGQKSIVENIVKP